MNSNTIDHVASLVLPLASGFLLALSLVRLIRRTILVAGILAVIVAIAAYYGHGDIIRGAAHEMGYVVSGGVPAFDWARMATPSAVLGFILGSITIDLFNRLHGTQNK
ncbi:MAG TPA: hypothetical protein VG722_09530 [Tepidisphaeraceae bacterium]|nr:hypothetical protein [Tepidisphaeraceae bacterium]